MYFQNPPSVMYFQIATQGHVFSKMPLKVMYFQIAPQSQSDVFSDFICIFIVWMLTLALVQHYEATRLRRDAL